MKRIYGLLEGGVSRSPREFIKSNIKIIGAFTPDSSFILGSSPLASAKTESDIDFSLGSSSNTSGIARLNEIKGGFCVLGGI